MKPRTKSRTTDPEAQACKAAPADQSAPPSLADAPSLEELKRAEGRLERLLAREQDARLQAEVMRDANLALTKELGLERVLETLLTCLRQLVPYDTANVMLCDEASQVTVTAMRGYENFLVDPAVVKANSLDANKNALLRTIFSTGQSVLVPDTEQETAWQRVPGSEHVRNWIGVPLVANGKV